MWLSLLKVTFAYMMKQLFSVFVCLSFTSISIAQSYTSYLTGSAADVSPSTEYGVCLMGGSTEDDNAMTWLLEKAAGGDIVVIRTSGSDGYNDYLYSDLGVSVNSVETIRFNSAAASTDTYVLQQLQNAEMIWIAGGDQGVYESYWKDTQVETILNNHINVKQSPIGGTSAGMAILSEDYFSASNGTITSAQALANPFHPNMTVATDFLSVPLLDDVTTDTHFDDPDRKGRLMTFLGRQVNDYGHRAFAIACDEYVAVCIDENGIANVYGDYPGYDDNAYFLQTNCDVPFGPETCNPSVPLDWNRNGAAVKVYAVKGMTTGSGHLDLNDWETGNNGEWQNWFVSNGVLNETAGTPPNCNQAVGVRQTSEAEPFLWNGNQFTLQSNAEELRVLDVSGRLMLKSSNSKEIDLNNLPQGLYLISVSNGNQSFTTKVVKL
jgi:cyanophycinase-like exopeptidase